MYCTAKVISRAGKSTGKYSAYYNIKYKTPDNLSSVQRSNDDIKNLSDVTIIPNQSQQSEISNSESVYYVVELFETQNIHYENARQNELGSWKDNKVLFISTLGMLSKTNQHRIKTKVRLVAWGFEEDCLRKSEKESPACPKDSFRAMLGLTVHIIIDKFAIIY